MSIRSSLTGGIETIFSSLKDLVKPAVLAGKLVSGFNFATSQTTATTNTTTVEIIVLTSKLTEEGDTEETVLIREKDIDLSLYSTVTHSSQLYRIICVESFEGVVVVSLRSV